MIIKDKVFVITGAGNGIGREVVLRLLKEGAKVFGLDISKTGLEETKKLANDNKNNFETKVISVTDKEEIEKLPSEVMDRFHSIDGLLNIAGIIQPFVKVEKLEYNDIERVMNINFNGVLYMTKTFLPYLLNAKDTAYIGNVSSMGGFLPVPGQAVYGASKAAVKLFTEALYAELKDTNVKVSIIFPGAVQTNITANSNIEIKNMGESASKYKMLSATKAGEIIVKSIQKNKFRVFVGTDSKFMNFLTRLAPKKAIHFIAKQMKSLLG